MSFVFGGCRGNQNNFLTQDDCQALCGHVRPEEAAPATTARPPPQTTILPALQRFTDNEEPVDCVLSQWSEWSACSVACGQGFSEARRSIIVEPRNGGAPCLRRYRRRRCNGNHC